MPCVTWRPGRAAGHALDGEWERETEHTYQGSDTLILDTKFDLGGVRAADLSTVQLLPVYATGPCWVKCAVQVGPGVSIITRPFETH